MSDRRVMRDLADTAAECLKLVDLLAEMESLPACPYCTADMWLPDGERRHKSNCRLAAALEPYREAQA